MHKHLLFVLFLVCSNLLVFGQTGPQSVKISVIPNSSNWEYKLGEKAKFDVVVTKDGIPIKDVAIRYEISHDMMPPHKKGEEILKDGRSTLDIGTMKTPGFLRCIVYATIEGKSYKGVATAGFEPQAIKTTTKMPKDFMEFWDQAKAENAKIPLNPSLRLLENRCTEKVNVYELCFQNYGNTRIYGILCIPKAPGKYPALLRVPGAGVWPFAGQMAYAENGVISLEIGIHGIPVTMDSSVYRDLAKTALANYKYFNWDNRDMVYFKRVYLGCVRAVDYIFTLEQFDGKNIGVQGGSQGGALSIVTAALDSRIKALIVFYPALCNLTGYLHKQAAGWPHLFMRITDPPCVLKQKAKTTEYYDVVNFARLIKVPGFYSSGFNDRVCPPTSTFSAYNEITAPKTFLFVPETEHYYKPEQKSKAIDFMMKALKDN